MTSYFPRFITEQEENEELSTEVPKEELKAVLESFKKAKSPGFDGWTVEFHSVIYDLMRDILKVVGETRSSGKVLGFH